MTRRSAINCSSSGRRLGRIIVFEGNDDSGKTTISKLIAKEIIRRGQKCIYLAFPGVEPDTLGAEVYAIHHDPRFVDAHPLGLQLLHVAAHIEAIERRIRPEIQRGAWFVLDRFWWSTWVYGLHRGASRRDIQDLIGLEQRHWGRIHPALVLLLTRQPMHYKCESPERQAIDNLYLRLSRQERKNHPVEIVKNDRTVADAFQKALAALLRYCPTLE